MRAPIIAAALCVVACARAPGDPEAANESVTSSALSKTTEVQVDTAIAQNAQGFQSSPAVAFNGAHYLVVWVDGRRYATGGDIWGARVSTSGVVLDPRGFVICDAPASQSFVRVAANSSGDFLVVWTDRRNGSGGSNSDIYGALVNTSAVTPVISPQNGVAIASTTREEHSAEVAWNDQNEFVVTWVENTTTNNTDVFARRVSSAGTPLDAAPFLVATGTEFQDEPTVAPISTTATLIAWRQRLGDGGTDIYGATLPNGISTPGTPRLVANAMDNELSPRLSPTGALLTWLTYGAIGCVTNCLQTVRAVRIGADGGAQLPVMAVYTAPTTTENLYEPKAVYHPPFSEYQLVWGSGAAGVFRLVNARLTTAGAATVSGGYVAGTNIGVIAPPPPTLPTPFYVWGALGPLGEADIFAAQTLSASAAIQSSSVFPVALGPNSQTAPSASWSGDAFQVTWLDNRAGARDVFHIPVSRDGVTLDVVGRTLTPDGGDEFATKIASNGSGLTVIAYSRQAGALETVLRERQRDGGLGLEAVRSGWLIQDLEWVDGEFVALISRPVGSFGSALALMPYHPARPFDGGFTTIRGDGGQVAFGELTVSATRLLATFQSGFNQASQLFGVLVDRDAGFPVRSHLTFAANTSVRESEPTAASDGTNFLVAWEDNRAPTAPDVFGALVSPAGVFSPTALVASPLAEAGPKLAFDGERYVLVYETGDAGLSAYNALAVQYVDATATAVGSSQQLREGVADDREVALASDLSFRTLVASSEYVASAAGTRLFVQRIAFRKPAGDPCASGAECLSSFCVDSVCCGTSCGGGVDSDCLVCSAAKGAPANGQCGRATGFICRPGTDLCDAPESCSGNSDFCGPDVLRAAADVCRPATGACDVEESCNGTSASCPTDQLRPSGFECRPAFGGTCDVSERCDGVTATCPADAFKPQGEICREPTACAEIAYCVGGTLECPTPQNKTNGTACSDEKVADGKCESGVCVPANRKSHYALLSCSSGAGGPMILLALVALLRRRRLAQVALPALLLFGASHALAADKPKATFIGLTAGKEIDPEVARQLSNYVQSQIARLDVYDILGPAEVQAIIGLERQRQLLGCSEGDDMSCLAEIGGALNASRAISGDLSVVGGSTVLNLSLIDTEKNAVIKRVGKRAYNADPAEALLDLAPAAAVELVSADPQFAGRKIEAERGFGGIVAGVRGDGDLTGRGIAPGITAELSTRRFGGAVTVLYGAGPGVRAEGRFYPVELGVVRPYLGIGASVFAPDVAARGALGAAARFGRVQLFADAAYERFFNPGTAFVQNSLIFGAGLGWAF